MMMFYICGQPIQSPGAAAVCKISCQFQFCGREVLFKLSHLAFIYLRYSLTVCLLGVYRRVQVKILVGNMAW